MFGVFKEVWARISSKPELIVEPPQPQPIYNPHPEPFPDYTVEEIPMISYEAFVETFPRAKNAEAWVEVFNHVLPQHGIDTPERVVAFVAQCGHETAGWRYFKENMNYSAERMMQVWPRRFDEELAHYCHRNPERVANHAYSNRMGNGDPESGDGWRFIGRGPIHLTGRNNYTAFAETMFPDDPEYLLDNTELVAEDPEVSLLSAIWYWNEHNLNSYADAQDMRTLTRKINGGYNGVDERQAYYDQLMSYIS